LRPPKDRSSARTAPRRNQETSPKEDWLTTSDWTARGILLAVVLAVYWNAFGTGIVLDANQLVASDSRIRGLSFENLKVIFTTDYWWPSSTDRLYRPLSTISFLFNYAVLGNGPQPLGYHAMNILLHALNSWLVFALARRTLKSARVALFAACLWAAHPIGVDAVTNIAGRADLLASAGILGGLCLYARGSDASPLRRAGLAACATLAIFSKENGAMLIALMALWDLVPGIGERANLRKRAIDYLMVAAPIGLWLFLRFRAFESLSVPLLAFVDNPLRGATFWAARWTAVKVLALDLALLIWPARLTFDRAYHQIPIAGAGDPLAWIGLIAAAAIFGLAIWKRRQEPLWFWAAGFFGLTLLPSSNLAVIIGATMAERFLYLPSIAFAVTVAALAARHLRPRQAAMALGAAIVLYGGRTLARNPDWQDNLTLAAHDSRVSTESFRVRAMHGEFLFGKDKRNLDLATRELEKAWSVLEPLPGAQSEPNVPATLGLYYLVKGDQSGSKTAEGQRWYGKARTVLERADRTARAIQEAMDTAQLEHGKPLAARRPYGRVYLILGDTYRALGNHAAALEAYRTGREFDPAADEGYDGAANAHLALGQPEMAALIEFEKALVVGSTPKSVALVEQAYGQVPGGACAVTTVGGVKALNPACPRLREDICRALADVSRTFVAARRPDRARTFDRTAVEQYGCPQSH
jgi:tetratricopeptide (TPR) repeat protein